MAGQRSEIKYPQDIRTLLTFRDDLEVIVIDRVIVKGRCIVVLEALQKQALQQLNVNQMGNGH